MFDVRATIHSDGHWIWWHGNRNRFFFIVEKSWITNLHSIKAKQIEKQVLDQDSRLSHWSDFNLFFSIIATVVECRSNWMVPPSYPVGGLINLTTRTSNHMLRLNLEHLAVRKDNNNKATFIPKSNNIQAYQSYLQSLDKYKPSTANGKKMFDLIHQLLCMASQALQHIEPTSGGWNSIHNTVGHEYEEEYAQVAGCSFVVLRFYPQNW